MKKHLFLLRGLPGAGKSTLSQSIGGKNFEADSYFMRNGKYEFDASKLGIAHKICQDSCKAAMEANEPTITISNTLTTERELNDYYKLANEFGYTIFSLIVENRHNGINVHNVPEEALERMEGRFVTKLR